MNILTPESVKQEELANEQAIGAQKKSPDEITIVITYNTKTGAARVDSEILMDMVKMFGLLEVAKDIVRGFQAQAQYKAAQEAEMTRRLLLQEMGKKQ